MTQTNESVRVSQLIGADVFDGAVRIGRVRDVRLERQPSSRAHFHDYVVSGFLCSDLRFGVTLGYGRPEQKGPWLLARIMHFLHRHDRLIRWDDVARIQPRGLATDPPGQVHLRQ